MSLLPGWDVRVPEAPKDFIEEQQEAQQPLGYFAKLEKVRSKRHPAGSEIEAPFVGALPPSYSLHRGSIPVDEAPVSPRTALGRMSSPSSLPQPRHSSDEHESLHAAAQRCGSLHALAHAAGTDWAEELETLSGGHKAAPHGAARSSKEQAGTHTTAAWWSHMDAGALNLHADVPEDRKACMKEHFTPQFDVVGQKLQYVGTSKEVIS